MPWKEWSLMLLRREFVELAIQSEANVKQLCDRFGISRKTGYKWLKRYREARVSGLWDRSRRPQQAPERSSVEVEAKVLAVRDANPAWGARKIRTRLEALSGSEVPAGSTIHAILRRHGRVNLSESSKHRPGNASSGKPLISCGRWISKGILPWATDNGVIRWEWWMITPVLLVPASLPQRARRDSATAVDGTFRRYGLPQAMLMDNGAPWGSDRDHRHTVLTVWLLRLGVEVRHGRPWHPETQGKQERFHRSLKAEVLAGPVFGDFAKVQTRFDQWRQVYNHEWPHQALGMAVPTSRYQVSPRTFPEVLPGIEYSPGDIVRKVQDQGRITFHNRDFRVGTAFRGYPVAVRPTLQEGVFTVHFCSHQIAEIQLRDPP